MKKLLFFLFLLIPFMVQAQTYYKCIGNNVKLRKGPGNNYKFEHLFCQGEDTDTPAQMSKDEIVKYTGKQRNGYKKVESVWGGVFSWAMLLFGMGILPIYKTRCQMP